ncbi:MAG: hypothetical protein CSA60_03340 [Neptuniibacter caesariensis]|uniref:Uncharacterized protein n=1 Tax=Neptuniibacter caesariensis TaxID=207954 RepID=A0A2G6JLF6_NEPCE|nr:MAG: hypothetical protein CSA60_03340 [Neptuniibacter caesariensis]
MKIKKAALAAFFVPVANALLELPLLKAESVNVGVLMNKMIIIGAVAALVLVAGAGFFGFKMYSELAQYKAMGSSTELRQFRQKNFELDKQTKALTKELDEIKRELQAYRKAVLDDAVKRSKRKIATSIAAFQQLSGPYVLTAMATQEQLELCQDVQKLMSLESKLFQTHDKDAEAQQEKVCNTFIDRKLIPLFKYQMLRNRVNLSGSMGHLKADAEKKFKNARKLLQTWNVPVARELESYTRFNR